MIIRKAETIGFCYGVKRAIEILENTVKTHGPIETLGAIVHNEQVLKKLEKQGVKVANNLNEVEGTELVVSAHGISQQLRNDIEARGIKVIDTTCPYVHRAQNMARRLSDGGCFVVIYGDAEHQEVQGILGHTNNNGIATTSVDDVKTMERIPRHIGVVSQTTQVPRNFNEFTKQLFEETFGKDSELRVIDTICHDIRTRQANAFKLAQEVDLMLVIGGRTSANTRHLAELCGRITPTYHISTADEIKPEWLENVESVGVVSGASTPEETIDEVIDFLKAQGGIYRE